MKKNYDQLKKNFYDAYNTFKPEFIKDPEHAYRSTDGEDTPEWKAFVIAMKDQIDGFLDDGIARSTSTKKDGEKGKKTAISSKANYLRKKANYRYSTASCDRDDYVLDSLLRDMIVIEINKHHFTSTNDAEHAYNRLRIAVSNQLTDYIKEYCKENRIPQPDFEEEKVKEAEKAERSKSDAEASDETSELESGNEDGSDKNSHSSNRVVNLNKTIKGKDDDDIKVEETIADPHALAGDENILREEVYEYISKTVNTEIRSFIKRPSTDSLTRALTYMLYLINKADLKNKMYNNGYLVDEVNNKGFYNTFFDFSNVLLEYHVVIDKRTRMLFMEAENSIKKKTISKKSVETAKSDAKNILKKKYKNHTAEY